MTAQPFRTFRAVLTAVLVVAGGVGWMALLAHVAPLGVGPPVPGALPLQRLAGGEAQPLVRVLFAWIGAGLAMRAVLASAPRGGLPRAATAAIVGAVTLVAVGGVQDAVTASEPLAGHLLPQVTHAGLWVAVAVLAACALIPTPREARTGAGADATRRRTDGGAAGGRTPRPA